MSCWWPDLSQHCTKLRKLTKKGTPSQIQSIYWRKVIAIRQVFIKIDAHAWEHHGFGYLSMKRIKDLLSDTANLAPYDPRSKTELLTDTSRLGLGFVLIQFYAVSRKWRLIRAGSTALKKAQKRYPPIQLELLRGLVKKNDIFWEFSHHRGGGSPESQNLFYINYSPKNPLKHLKIN